MPTSLHIEQDSKEKQRFWNNSWRRFKLSFNIKWCVNYILLILLILWYYVDVLIVTLFCYFAFRYFDFAKVFIIQNYVFFSTTIRPFLRFIWPFLVLCKAAPNIVLAGFYIFGMGKSARKHVAPVLFFIYSVFNRSCLCQNENSKISGNKTGWP